MQLHSLRQKNLGCVYHLQTSTYLVPKPDGASSALKKWQQQSALPISCNCPQHVSGQFHGYSEKSDPQPFGGASKNSSPAVGPRHCYPSWKCQTSRSQKGAYHTLSWHWHQCVCVWAPLRLHPLTKDVKDPAFETQWARQRGCQLMSCMSKRQTSSCTAVGEILRECIYSLLRFWTAGEACHARLPSPDLAFLPKTSAWHWWYVIVSLNRNNKWKSSSLMVSP